MAASPLVRAVRAVRRRLFVQSLLNHLIAGWSIALVLSVAVILIEPLVFSEPAAQLRMLILVGVGSLVTAVALFNSVRRMPSSLEAALELDKRFQLHERCTTAIGLRPEQRTSPSGRAVFADAELRTTGLRVHDKFLIRLHRRARCIPFLLALLAVFEFVYHPVVDSELMAGKQPIDSSDQANRSASVARQTQGDSRKKSMNTFPERANRSKDVQELQDELARLEAALPAMTPAETVENMTAITSAEERANALAKEKADRLNRLESKLAQLAKPTGTEGLLEGPGKEFNDALASGDLDRATNAINDIVRQLGDPNLDPAKKDQLQKQLETLSTNLRQAASNRGKVEELTRRIADARAQNIDTSGLEQELAAAQADAEKSTDIERLADKLDAAKQALRDGKPADAAKQLDGAAKQLNSIKDEVQDLKELQEQHKRLSQLKAQSETNAAGIQPGNTGLPTGSGMSPSGEPLPSVNAGGGGPGSGVRQVNSNTSTASTDQRQRTPFDGKGQKSYAGATPGGGYTKKSPSELGPAIDRAVQEAPDAVSNQPLSRDDKEAVKEFYRDLPKK